VSCVCVACVCGMCVYHVCVSCVCGMCVYHMCVSCACTMCVCVVCASDLIDFYYFDLMNIYIYNKVKVTHIVLRHILVCKITECKSCKQNFELKSVNFSLDIK